MLEEFTGNPFIEGLPPVDDLLSHLMVQPPYSDDMRTLPDGERLFNLRKIAKMHLPTSEEEEIMYNISRCLRWSYANRNPLDFEVVKKTLKARGKQLTDATENYLRRCIYAPVYGFPVIGVSGSGKTSWLCSGKVLMPKSEHGIYDIKSPLKF